MSALECSSVRSYCFLGRSFYFPRQWVLGFAACVFSILSCNAIAEEGIKELQSDIESPRILENVEVIGSGLVDTRREANASKVVVAREDIVRFGDASVAEVLQRVPGISVTRNQGRDVEIRLRGLGDGYTQILVDGSPAPRGFSIESLSTDMIERVEVLRSATAELSSQAIAGAINIVLKRSKRQRTRSSQFALGGYRDCPSARAAIDYADSSERLSWTATSSVSLANDHWPAKSNNTSSARDEIPIYARTNAASERSKLINAAVAPGIEYEISDRSSFGVDGWLQSSRERYSNTDRRIDIVGEQPQFGSDFLTIDAVTTQASVTTRLKAPVSENGQIESKLILAGSRRKSDGGLIGNDISGKLLLRRSVPSVATERSGSMVGKLSLGLENAHTISLGWDGQGTQRFESRLQRETSPVDGYPIENLDEKYTARIYRVALFAQDEWEVSPLLGAYFGVRWEGLRTRIEGREFEDISVRSAVLSPVVQLLLKLPETAADQIRLNIGRTYKTPMAQELIPRRYVVNDNTAATPNFQGNPRLQPELAWGLDIGYERYIGDAGFLGVSAFARRIDNVILPRVLQIDGAWVEIPSNSGRADVQGVEFEAKGSLRELVAEAPSLGMRLGLTRNWSRVAQVPEPGNRLAQQPRFTASLGVDWRIEGTNWTTGSNYSFDQGGYSRNNVTTATVAGAARKLDFYGLWEPDKLWRLRLSLSNVLAPEVEKRTLYEDGQMFVSDTSRTTSFVAFSAQLELTF